jgi:NAD(P)H dehydrogenase (quinone)
VIEAAKTADVALLAYTSILGGPATRFVVADDHHSTEQAIEHAGLPFTFLRNGWYTENYTAQLPNVLAGGAIIGTAGPESRLATATRNDYAAAAAIVLAGEGHQNMTYAIARGELATVTGDLSRLIGRPSTDLSTTIKAELVMRTS